MMETTECSLKLRFVVHCMHLSQELPINAMFETPYTSANSQDSISCDSNTKIKCFPNFNEACYIPT